MQEILYKKKTKNNAVKHLSWHEVYVVVHTYLLIPRVHYEEYATHIQRFAGRLRDCSRVESYSSKHNWPQHHTSL